MRKEEKMAVLLSCVNHMHYGYITVMTNADIPDPPDVDPNDPPIPPLYSDVVAVVIKRKIKDEFLFESIYMKQISVPSDFDITFNDPYCRNNYEYQYKVEYINEEGGTVDSTTYNIKSVFDLLVIADANEIWYTPLNVSAINPTRIKPFAMNTPIYAKKPSMYYYNALNYEEGSCTGIFLKMIGDEDNIQFDTSYNWKYRKQFKDFITKGNAKIIKSVSGEIWMVGIKTDSITDNSLFSNAEIEGARQIEFGWVEVGEVDNEKDLYDNGLINVPEEYWSGQ